MIEIDVPCIDEIPDWVEWIAQDESGIWWGYSVEPHRYDHGWYENEVGDSVKLVSSSPAQWKNSLMTKRTYQQLFLSRRGLC